METIVPATGGDPGWRICIPATDQFGQSAPFHQLSILAWAIDPQGAVTPITPFGRTDTSRPWVLADPFGNIIVMPGGPILRSHHDATRYFEAVRRNGAA